MSTATEGTATQTRADAGAGTSTGTNPSYEEIAEHAYRLYESGTPGDSVSHWLAAERELIQAAGTSLGTGTSGDVAGSGDSQTSKTDSASG